MAFIGDSARTCREVKFADLRVSFKLIPARLADRGLSAAVCEMRPKASIIGDQLCYIGNAPGGLLMIAIELRRPKKTKGIEL